MTDKQQSPGNASKKTPNVLKITDKNGKEWVVVPENHVAVPGEQIQNLVKNHQELQKNFKILNDDMGVAVKSQIFIMTLLGGKITIPKVIKLTRKMLNQSKEAEKVMAPFDYLIKKYARASEESENFDNVPFELTYDEWKTQQGITESN